MGERESEPREGCCWPAAALGLLAKPWPDGCSAPLLVGMGSPLAPRKELGFRIGTRGRSVRPAQGLGQLSPPPSQSLGDFLLTPLCCRPHWTATHLGVPVVSLTEVNNISHSSLPDYLSHVLQTGKRTSRQGGSEACLGSPSKLEAERQQHPGPQCPSAESSFSRL